VSADIIDFPAVSRETATMLQASVLFEDFRRAFHDDRAECLFLVYGTKDPGLGVAYLKYVALNFSLADLQRAVDQIKADLAKPLD